ncbi:hypothetical protein JTB14_011324 [Gonioctena quinquepunctata]|nr:hypothetical protein JTB14_011324 [Gonioctena quinquepunctata]
MADIKIGFQSLQKVFQETNLILPDIISTRDAALRKLNAIESGPCPTEAYHENDDVQDNSDSGPSQSTNERNVPNLYVTTGRHARLNVEVDLTIRNMISLISATSQSEMISAGRPLIETQFGAQAQDVTNFERGVCDCWPKIIKIKHIAVDASKYADKLRKLIVYTKGTLQKISSNADTLDDRLMIALNGQRTAYFDPRPAIADFFRRKDRRYREPTPEIYQNGDFIEKFCRKETEFDF